MPLYEYSCGSCGARFEELQRIGASSADVVCPHCGARDARKELSTFASSVQGAAPCGAASSSSCGSGGFT